LSIDRHNSDMTSVTSVLKATLAAQGRTARQGQIDAAGAIDAGDQHTALQCPTGVGKSALAVAVSVARQGGVIAVHSNGLVQQYAAEASEWEEATGFKVRTLVGRGHYWCPKASPDLAGLTPAQKDHVTATGTFIGSGIDPKVYKLHTVLSLAGPSDEEDAEEDAPKTACEKCPLKKGGCPLWAARDAAAAAGIVITNATMLGVALGGGAEWSKGLLKPVIVLDEAHADADHDPSHQGHLRGGGHPGESWPQGSHLGRRRLGWRRAP
jgi:Rad3-related DNA helicase